MKCFEIVFSPTGGTKRIADIVSKGLAEERSTIDLTDSKADFPQASFAPGDLAVIAVPSYGGRAPAVAVERLRKLKGNGARAVIVSAYGNRAFEDTLAELKDTAEGAGFCVIAAIAAVAEHSIMRQFAEGRPDEEDRKLLESFSEQILEKLNSASPAKPDIPGNRPYKKAVDLGLVPKTGKGCTNCGLCAERCPVAAISAENASVVNKETCISCMRCVSVCPQHAKHLNGLLLRAASLLLKKACSTPQKCELYL